MFHLRNKIIRFLYSYVDIDKGDGFDLNAGISLFTVSFLLINGHVFSVQHQLSNRKRIYLSYGEKYKFSAVIQYPHS